LLPHLTVRNTRSQTDMPSLARVTFYSVAAPRSGLDHALLFRLSGGRPLSSRRTRHLALSLSIFLLSYFSCAWRPSREAPASPGLLAPCRSASHAVTNVFGAPAPAMLSMLRATLLATSTNALRKEAVDILHCRWCRHLSFEWMVAHRVGGVGCDTSSHAVRAFGPALHTRVSTMNQ